jgi:hypothetical protein
VDTTRVCLGLAADRSARSGGEGLGQASKQASRQAGKQASRQAGKQAAAGKQPGNSQAVAIQQPSSNQAAAKLQPISQAFNRIILWASSEQKHRLRILPLVTCLLRFGIVGVLWAALPNHNCLDRALRENGKETSPSRKLSQKNHRIP